MISDEEDELVCVIVEEAEFKGARSEFLTLLDDLERDLHFLSTDPDFCFNIIDPERDRDIFSAMDCGDFLFFEGDMDFFLETEVDLILCLLAPDPDRDLCLFTGEIRLYCLSTDFLLLDTELDLRLLEGEGDLDLRLLAGEADLDRRLLAGDADLDLRLLAGEADLDLRRLAGEIDLDLRLLG